MNIIIKKITAAAMAATIGLIGASSVAFAEDKELAKNTEKYEDRNIVESTRYISYNLATGEERIIDIIPDYSGDDVVESNMLIEAGNIGGQAGLNVVIGNDNRNIVSDTTVSPYKAIGYLSVTKNGSNHRGTCACFASNAALTAAHVVWDSANSVAATNYSISFGRNGNVYPYNTITEQPVEIIIPEEYKNTGSTQYDYAILLYDDNTTISYYKFGFGKTLTTSTHITVTGYPKDTSGATGGSSNSYQQWTDNGYVTSLGTSTISYTIDTTGGQSGAPVYKDNNVIVAVHHGGNSTANTAKRIDDDLFSLMKSIKEGTYSS